MAAQNHDEIYTIATCRKFKCKACAHQFSVTAGTIFASRKMDFVDLLAAICIIVNASKGVSMIQLSRDLDCQYTTACLLSHKPREAMAREVQTGVVPDGHVVIDGAYFGGHIRPENSKADRKNRRFKEHQTGKRRVVVVMRERLMVNAGLVNQGDDISSTVNPCLRSNRQSAMFTA